MDSIPDDPHPPNASTWLAGHPIIDPRHNDAAVHFKKPDDADDAAGLPDVRQQIVVAAIDAMFDFSGPDLRRDRAVNILKDWRRYYEMTPAEIDAVLDSYPAPVWKRGMKKEPKAVPTTNRRGI